MYTPFMPGDPKPTPSGAATTTDETRLNPWLLWRPESPDERRVLTVAELAECVCPDLCDRDHANE